MTHLTKAEITSLAEGPYLPGGTVLHDLVYGYAADASLEPEWLVITDVLIGFLRVLCARFSGRLRGGTVD